MVPEFWTLGFEFCELGDCRSYWEWPYSMFECLFFCNIACVTCSLLPPLWGEQSIPCLDVFLIHFGYSFLFCAEFISSFESRRDSLLFIPCSNFQHISISLWFSILWHIWCWVVQNSALNAYSCTSHKVTSDIYLLVSKLSRKMY